MTSPTQVPQDDAFYPSVPPISLELTSKCNLKCPYCANSQLTRPQAFIAWTLLEKIVDDCAQAGYNIAALHGTGEPMLWKRLEDVIRLIKLKGAGDGSFATNGTLLTRKRVEKLLDAGLRDLRISLDSLDPQIYAATRGGKVEKVIKNIQTLIEMAPEDFTTTIVLMRHKEQDIDNAQISLFYRTFGIHENVRLEIVENGLMVSAPEDYRAQPIKVSRCNRPREWFTITSQGIVSVCCSDQNALGVLGDMRFQTIDEIWYSEKTQVMLSNIALGRGVCPDVCTKHCWLETPQVDAGADLDTCHDWPMPKLMAEIERCVLEGNFALASENLTALEMRDPDNPRFQHFVTVLQDVAAGGAAGISANSAGAMKRMAADAAEKDQLIRKHHDFAQRLLGELAERDIHVDTHWES